MEVNYENSNNSLKRKRTQENESQSFFDGKRIKITTCNTCAASFTSTSGLDNHMWRFRHWSFSTKN